MINVIVVEDNDIIRNGLAALIEGTDGFKCTGAFVDCESMLSELEELLPDVVLMDIGLPGVSGIVGARRIKQICPDIEILMLTVYEDNERVFEALCAGATGYLVKKTPPSRLLEAIREAYEGGSPMSSQIARKVVSQLQQKTTARAKDEATTSLTSRETEILEGLVNGQTYQAIALTFNISIDTVRFHIRNIYRKLHVHSESEAVAKAMRQGYI